MNNAEQDMPDRAATKAVSAELCRKTAGERIHNEITYRGIDFAANTAFAVAFTVLTARTKTGRNLWTDRIENGFKYILKPIVKDTSTRAEWAGHGGMFASIMAGGTAIIPPMIVMEKNKRSIVESLDRKIYGDEEVDRNERFSIRYRMVEQEPRKDFATGMAARLVVLTPMIWGHMKYNDQMNNIMYKHVSNASQYVARKVGYTPKGFMAKTQDGQTNWQFLNKALGVDVSLTFIYSFAHEWAYKGLSGIFGKKKDEASRPPEPTVEGGSIQLKTLLKPKDAEVRHG